MRTARRFRLFMLVTPVVAALVLLKLFIHRLGWELVALDALVPSAVAGAIFIMGFLLSHVLADYKEAERAPGEIRIALETLHDEAANFARRTAAFDIQLFRAALKDIVYGIEQGLTVRAGGGDLKPVLARVDALSGAFSQMEQLGMSERYIVRLRNAQDAVRGRLFRIAYVQKIQFVPSVYVMVQTLVAACLGLMLVLKTAGSLESALVLALVGYLFVYALFLIRSLETPFRKGEASVDDVSLFLLREFAEKLDRALPPPLPADAETLRRVAPVG